MDQAYIHDGYTKTAYIGAMEGIHPSLRFKYRAMLSQDRAVIMSHLSNYNDPRREQSLSAATISQYVVSWDMTKQDGSAVDLGADEVLRVNPTLSSRVWAILLGADAPDADPDATEVEDASDAEAELEAALKGTTPEALDAKN